MPIRSDTLDSFDDWEGTRLPPKYLGGYVIDPPPRPNHPPVAPPVSSGAAPFGNDPATLLAKLHDNHVHWALDETVIPRCGLFQAIRNRLALWIGGRGVTQSNDCY